MRLPVIGGGGGIGVILLLVVLYFIGGPDALQQILGGTTSVSVDDPTTVPQTPSRPADEASDFVHAVLGSTEDVWTQIFADSGERYVPPRLTMFSDAANTACGFNTSAVGPFYCPPDRRVYLDVSFFDDLARMGGPGDFAQAYVIGHEVGHHIQNLLGTADQVRSRQQQGDQREANRLQVMMELQADCYAGVWAHHANQSQGGQLLEHGDIDEGLAAAAAIGDDRLQRSAGRAVSPESFTHGTSAQRKQWLERGLTTGDPNACNTFGA
jgi:predicted metalloprotease